MVMMFNVVEFIDFKQSLVLFGWR